MAKNKNSNKIKKISSIWDGSSLKFDDFTGMDLSNIDLSSIPPSAWENCIFDKTNFSNTNIRFYPNKLRRTALGFIDMLRCDFSGCDLSYLTCNDFIDVYKSFCNFRNTGMFIDWNVLNIGEGINAGPWVCGVAFDSCYESMPSSFWDNLNIDLETLDLNPNINISSSKLWGLFFRKGQYAYNYYDWLIEKVNKYEKYLSCDQDGDLKRLYEIVKCRGTLLSRNNFFSGKIENINFDGLDLSNIDPKILNLYEYSNCSFNNVTINVDLEFLTDPQNKKLFDLRIPTEVYLQNMPKIERNSWEHLKGTRIIDSSVTFRVNCYVELGRMCNAKCKFCRNNSFEKCNYSFDNIKASLFKLYPYLDDIVIGGGEPTLLIDELKILKQYVEQNFPGHHNMPNWYIFTNGRKTPNIQEWDSDNNIYGLMDLKKYGFKFNISRHAVSNIKNAAIFDVNPDQLMAEKELCSIAGYPESTLCATCFQGGLNDIYNIVNYLLFAKRLSFGRVLLSNLHKDNSSGKSNEYMKEMYIDDNLFDELDAYLINNGYQKNLPIFSTGGYISIVYKTHLDGSMPRNIVIKKYISRQELEDCWDTATKRTFDFSISPDGNIYDSWHQQSSPVKIIK